MTALTIILCCQLFGELLTTFSGLPMPGPVVGMVILFAGLVVRGSIPDELTAVSNTLLENLSLLFVPAGVGIMLHIAVIERDWLPISVSLVVSSMIGVAVTGLTMSWLGGEVSELKDIGSDQK